MLLIFLDTEFTRFEKPELISIGLASANGREFYAEVAYTPSSCSQFVRDVVVPLLSCNHHFSPGDLRKNILKWLDLIRNDETVLVCFDSEFDKNLFLTLFDDDLPTFIIFRSIGHRYINGFMRAEFYYNNSLKQHHALNDAMALRYAFRGWVRAVR